MTFTAAGLRLVLVTPTDGPSGGQNYLLQNDLGHPGRPPVDKSWDGGLPPTLYVRQFLTGMPEPGHHG